MEEKGCEFSEFGEEDQAKVTELVKGYWDEVTAEIDGGAEKVDEILALAK